MYGIGNISSSVSKMLTPAETLGAPGDMYVITDTRLRPRKDLSETKALQRYQITPYDANELPLENENGVVLFPVKDLNFDTANFQNRDAEFSEASVNRILDAVMWGEFNWAAFDPITIWRNPEDGKFYVLSGHSRSEAFRRLSADGEMADGRNFDKIPAKIFNGTFEQAKELALNSNTLSTKETDLERASYYRDRRNKLQSSGTKNSEIKKRLLDLARKNEGKNATKIIYLSYLNPRGKVVDAVAATSDGASIDKNRVAVMAEWVGHLRYDFPQLTDFHESELFDFLKNGHYGVDVRNFNDFAKRVQTAIEKHTEWGVFDADKSLNLEKNLGKSENEKRFDAELARLKNEWAEAENVLNRKLGEFKARQKRDASITDAQILKAVQPYKDAAILAKAAYFAFRDKRGEYLRADENQLALFGLGKPTIKLEFETNGELADFLKDNKKAASFAEYTDVSASAQSAPKAHTSGRSSVRQNFLMPGSGPNLFPESVAPSLPPTKTPPPLPPSTSTSPDVPPLPSFDAVLKNDLDKSDWNRIGFKVGNVGYINDKLQYLDVYIPRYYDIIENWMKFAEYLYPNFVVALCRANKDKWIFAFDAKKYSKFLRQFYDNRTKDMSFTQRFVFVYDVDLMEQVVKHFNDNGMQVALFYRHVYDGDQPEIITHPTAALPPYVAPESPTESEPQPEPTTPEVTAEAVTDEEIDTTNQIPVSVNFNDLQKHLYNASYWSSFDPDRAAASDVAAMKSDYNTYAAEVPDGYENAFNAFFNKLSNNIISLKSKTANVAVTGSGGISARKAERLNRNFDAYMQAWRNFDTELERYVNKLKRRAKRREFLSKSLDERSDDRINELKRYVDAIAKAMADVKSKDINDIKKVIDIDFYKKHYDFDDQKAFEWALSRYRAGISEAKQTLLKKVENEYYKKHQRTVNAIIEYIKEKEIYTPKSKIFGYYQEIQESEPDTANDGTKFQGAEILANEHLDRLQIKFDSKPSEEVRNDLKKSGFRWSPHYGVWQRQLTNDAMWNAKRILNKHFTPASLGKPTIKLEFENNSDLMSLFDTDGVSGMTVNDRPADVFNCPEWQLQCKGFTPTYERLENYDHLVAPSYGEKTLVGYGFDNATLDELVEACRNYRQVEGLAKHLQGDSALQSAFNIWHWLHTNVRYDYDAPGEEEIRTPARCYADRLKGVDCDCLAVMTACLLINMGYRPKFEIVGFGDDGKYSHIFVNLDGAAVDRVLPVFLQRPDHITNTKIMDIPVYRLNGCDVAEIRALSGIYADTLQRIENGDATADDSINFRKTQVLVTLQGSDPWAYRLGAVLMPYVAAVGDDGTYYFTNADIASLATQSDAELREMLANGIADEDINKWLANVIVKLNNAATADAMSLPGTSADATQVVVIINPQRQAVTVEGNMFSAEMVTCNPLTAAMLKNLQMLFAVNFLGIATRFAIGLISAEQAADLGYSFDAYTKAVAAVNKLKGFYSALGGNIDNVIATIQTGSAKMPLTEYDENAMLVEISDTDATINGLANAVAGINGLGGAVTIGTAIASLGDYLNIIIEWVKDVTPATSIAPGVSPDGTPAEDDGNLLWYLMAGFAAVGAVGAVSGKKKKTKKK